MFEKNAFINYDKKFIVREDLENELLLVMAYLRLNASYDGYVGFTLKHLIKDIGYHLNRHQGAINDTVRNILSDLQICGSIEPEINIANATINDFIRLQIYADEDSMFYLGDKSKYIQLNRDEYNKITKFKTKIDKATLLRVYLNIKKYINTSVKVSNDDRVAYPSMLSISRDCNITVGSTLDNAIKDLVNIGILFEHITGSYVDKKGNVRNANNVYALTEKSIKNAREIMLSYYKVESFGRVSKPNSRSKKTKEPKIKNELDQLKEN
jgi:hypothetical protein